MPRKYSIPQPPVDGPQYPYRVTDDMSPAEVKKVRDAIAIVIEETDGMVVRIAMDWFRNRKRHELDDIISEMVLYALKYTLPGYDASQGTKVSTYLYGGYVYGASLAYRNRKRQYAKNAKVAAAIMDKERYNTSYIDTDYVYDIAAELVSHPEKYFSGIVSKYIRDYHGDNVKRSGKDYGDPSSISRARKYVADLVSSMSVEPGEDLTKYQKGSKQKLDAVKMLEMHDSGITYREIADATGWSKDAVRYRIRKAQTNSKSPTP